ncbi:DUF1499 domain-containing protein [Rhizobiales bacterium]|uniref:DUF1499 domain-containing protein n=1 Tax=Hongsoonwoonella zoysiae TaxID=2821844 RepID=UPI0015616224|nr:DUF1499 domain-containing protein [Hongsoonwoonella zoysiae]NRG19676.1 DUF1499 domain-containing protein [Hongsoonwoonella zoysiae]
MHKHIPIRRPRTARIGYRAGLFAVPVLVVGALAHRAGMISEIELLPIMAFGFALGAVAVVASLIALVSLWEKGGVGWSAAVRGVIYGGIALVPLSFGLYGLLAYPRLADISTDIENPPMLVDYDRPEPSEADRQLQREAYSDLVPRRFRVLPEELHNAARQVVERNGWTVTSQTPPDLRGVPSRIQAEVRTLLFGFTDYIAIRVEPDPFGARLDVRSASLVGEHDLGANAERIRIFQEDLDAVLLEAFGALEPISEDEEAPPPPPELPLLSEVPYEERLGPPPLPVVKPAPGEQETDGELIDPLEEFPEDLREIYVDEPAEG